MPFRPDIVTITMVIFVLAALLYNISLLKNKKVFKLSLFFIIYAILIPTVSIVLLYSHTQSLMDTPLAPYTLIPDRFLEYFFLMAIVFTYSGNMVHIVTKSLAIKGLRNSNSEASQFNRYLHFSFSHNLIFSGVVLILLTLSLIELNHVSVSEYDKWISPIIRGVVMGLVYIFGMFRYTRSGEEEPGRWGDLKIVFALTWIGFIVIGYSVLRVDASLKDYPFVFPSLLGFALINILNIGLIYRHFKLKKSLPNPLSPS